MIDQTTISTARGQSLDEIGEVIGATRARRGAWSRRCPHCRSSALVGSPKGCLECTACKVVVQPPDPREQLPTHATGVAHPRWQDDHRLVDGTWDAYSREGELLGEWGRSTDRQDGLPPAEDEAEHAAPRVRAEAVRGRRDDALDAEIRAYVNETAGLRDALDAVKKLAARLSRIIAHPTYAATEVRVKIGGVDVRLDELGLAPTEERRRPIPRWHVLLAEHGRRVTLGLYGAVALLIVNALRRRGVAVDGSLDPVSPQIRRDTPYSSYGHAMAAAFGVNDGGHMSLIPRNAMATHKLPQGLVLGQIACKPSRSYRATAKELSSDHLDVIGAIASARVGARSYAEDGEIRYEPGRPLLPWELELVRLVDAGEEIPAAHRSKRTKQVDRLAVTRLTAEEALPKLRGFEGAALPRTVRELKIAARAARRAIRLELEDRALIPSAGGVILEDAFPDLPLKKRVLRTSRRWPSPFASSSGASA